MTLDSTLVTYKTWYIKGESLMLRLLLPQHSLELPRLGFEYRLSPILVQHGEQRVHLHRITKNDSLRPY